MQPDLHVPGRHGSEGRELAKIAGRSRQGGDYDTRHLDENHPFDGTVA